MAAPATTDNYRIRQKWIQITYPQAPHLTKDIVEAHVTSERLPTVKQYLIAQETHADGTLHFHVLLEWMSRPDIKNATAKFTIGENKPHFSKITNLQHWNYLVDTYLRKEDDEPLGNAKSLDYISLAKKRKVNEALEAFASAHPKEFMLHYERIKRNCYAMAKVSQEIRTKPYDSFKPSQGLLNALSNNYSVVIQGISGSGKTQFAMAWAQKHYPGDWAIVSHLDKLKKVDSERAKYPSVLIFDDMDFTQRPITGQIHLLDHELDREIHARYGNATIPAYTRKIFTCNDSRLPFSDDPDGAIQRRYKLVSVRAPLF